MTDQAQPTGQGKIIAALTVLVEETRQSKIDLTDIAARQTQHTADIRDLSSGLATTRRALDANAERDRELRDTGKNLQTLTAKLASETSLLDGLASRLEKRDARSKWDFVTLATGMVVAAMLAGSGAVYFTKQKLDTANFRDAVRLIQNDDDAYWCNSAKGQTVKASDGTRFCAVAMPQYEAEEPAE